MPNDTEQLLGRLRTFYDAGACILDEMELDSWAAQFTEDARYEVIPRENYDQGLPHATLYCRGIGMIHDRVTAIREALIYEERSLRHLISAVRLNATEGDELSTQANFLLIESMADKPPEMIMVGRYVDRLVDKGDAFMIRDRRCVFDNYWAPRAIIIPV